MGYNIVKVMVDEKGKILHILLTDGLSEILEIDEISYAMNMVKVLNENSDSGWDYQLRTSAKRVGGNS
jgi:hypothetical protein